ncbi:zinc finger protein 436 [Drosophila montana]|uniref:zinc finger protein 436 n=1 Tax=Drosophila montana TaxID=40370 RepID=UPI00313D8971
MDNEESNLHEVCRVCANKIKDKKRQRHIFNYLRGKLLQNLKLITGVELSMNEGLPKFICDRCYSELDLAIKFRERCIFSQKYLEEMLTKVRKEFVVNTAERELYEDLIDEEQLEYIDEDVQFLEDNDVGNLFEEMSAEITEDEVAETGHVEENANEDQSRSEKRHWVLLEDKRPAKRLRHFFICEECGEYFKNEYDYNEHKEGHLENKESKKFFPCYKCPATFKTRIALKLHRREEHSGERNFKCATCGETFLEHNAKQRHEKAHINERPYPCLECDKIFTSVSELRAHSTSHAMRKFRCEPCNMDFTMRKHLVAHSNTYPHKRTVQQMQDEIDMLYGETEEETEII